MNRFVEGEGNGGEVKKRRRLVCRKTDAEDGEVAVYHPAHLHVCRDPSGEEEQKRSRAYPSQERAGWPSCRRGM